MSFGDRKCEKCSRSHYTRDGQSIALEVCYSHKHAMWLCLRCFLGG